MDYCTTGAALRAQNGFRPDYNNCRGIINTITARYIGECVDSGEIKTPTLVLNYVLPDVYRGLHAFSGSTYLFKRGISIKRTGARLHCSDTRPASNPQIRRRSLPTTWRQPRRTKNTIRKNKQQCERIPVPAYVRFRRTDLILNVTYGCPRRTESEHERKLKKKKYAYTCKTRCVNIKLRKKEKERVLLTYRTIAANTQSVNTTTHTVLSSYNVIPGRDAAAEERKLKLRIVL